MSRIATPSISPPRFIGPESAIANGTTTIFDRLISYDISGGSMNPARTLGPALVAGALGTWWVFLFGPLLGMLIGVGLVSMTHGVPTRTEAQHSHG